MQKYRIEVITDANNEPLYVPQRYSQEAKDYIGFPNGPLTVYGFTEEREARTFLVKHIREMHEQKIRDLYLANKKIILKREHIYDIEGNSEV